MELKNPKIRRLSPFFFDSAIITHWRDSAKKYHFPDGQIIYRTIAIKSIRGLKPKLSMQTSRAANQNSTVEQTAFIETLKYARRNRAYPDSLEKPSTGR